MPGFSAPESSRHLFLGPCRAGAKSMHVAVSDSGCCDRGGCKQGAQVIYSEACQSGRRFEPSFVIWTKSISSPSSFFTQICHGPSGVGARQKTIIVPSGE